MLEASSEEMKITLYAEAYTGEARPELEWVGDRAVNCENPLQGPLK